VLGVHAPPTQAAGVQNCREVETEEQEGEEEEQELQEGEVEERLTVRWNDTFFVIGQSRATTDHVPGK